MIWLTIALFLDGFSLPWKCFVRFVLSDLGIVSSEGSFGGFANHSGDLIDHQATYQLKVQFEKNKFFCNLLTTHMLALIIDCPMSSIPLLKQLLRV